MGYYVRVFCTSPTVPPIRKVLNWAASNGQQLMIEPDYADIDRDSPNWKMVGITYKEGKLPFLAEVNRDDGTENSLLREEVEEFVDSVSEIEDSTNKAKVLRHLHETKYVVANLIPTTERAYKLLM